MSWDQVESVLSEYLPRIPTKWIESLGRDDISKDGWRLGLCIAIDLKSDALVPEDIGAILDILDPSEADARKAFGIAYLKHPDCQKLVCASKLNAPQLPPDDVYLRVLMLRGFMKFYVNPNNPHTFDPADVEDVRMSYFDEGAELDFADIEASWTGNNGVVWVMSYNDYLELTRGKSREERGTLMNDVLGLACGPSGSVNDGIELVGVKYPVAFTHACSQPTTLDADWMNDNWYYLSYTGEDGWGRTQSCSGAKRPVRERVHRGFEGLSADYTGLSIGPIGELIQDRKKLLVEGYRRFSAMDSAGILPRAS